MVSKNNRITKMQAVAEKQPHFGIRKLTIGAASVLLGTTLWLNGNVEVAHAANESNNNNNNNEKSSEGSQSQANNGASSASKVVVVVPNKAAEQASQSKSNNSSSVFSAQSATNNTSKSSTASSNSNTSSANLTSNNSIQTKSSVNTSSLEKDSKAIQNSASVESKNSSSSITQNSSVIKSTSQSSSSTSSKSAAASSSKAASLSATKNNAKQISSKAEDQQSSATAQNSAAVKTLMQDATANTAAQKTTVDSTSQVITKAGQSGKNTTNNLNLDLNKAALSGLVAKTQAANLDKTFLTSFVAAVNNNNAQAKATDTTNKNNTIDDKDFATASTWSEVEQAANGDAKGVKISGEVTADGDLNVAKDFTIEGTNTGARLNLDHHIINNSGTLTLANLTVDGNVLGSGIVNIVGTVNSRVDENGTHASNGQLSDQVGSHPGASSNNWYNPNIYAHQINVEQGATLNVNRTVTGDGLVATAGGTVNVGINGNLIINLKDANTASRANEQNTSIDNANAGIRIKSNGTFTTGDSAKVTINAGHGRAVVIDEPFGGTTPIHDNILATWENGRTGDRSHQASGQRNTMTLGDSTQMNITGRGGILLGYTATFTTGDHSIIHINNQGNGEGLLLDANSHVEISPHSQLLMHSDGKDSTGSYDGGNYIGMGQNGQFRVEHDATFRYQLVNAGKGAARPWADNFNIISQVNNAHPEVYVGPNAVFDGQSDYQQGNGEIFSFSLDNGSGNQDYFVIDGAKYVNWEKNGHNWNLVGGYPSQGNLYYSMAPSIISASGKSYYIFKWDNQNLNDHNYTFDDSSAAAIRQSIQNFENSSDEYWRGINHLATSYSRQGNTAEEPGHDVTASDITGVDTVGLKKGIPVNRFSRTASDNTGFDPKNSQRLVLVATIIPTQVDHTSQVETPHKVIIQYDDNLQPGQVQLRQKGQDGLSRTTETTYYNVDPATGEKTIDTTKGNNGHSTTTTVLNQAKDEIIYIGKETASITYNGYVGTATTPERTNTDNVSGQPVQTAANGDVEFVDGNGNTLSSLAISDDLNQIQYVNANGATVTARRNASGSYVDADGNTVTVTARPARIQYNNYGNRYDDYIQTYPNVTRDQWGGANHDRNATHNYNVTGWTLPAITAAVQNANEGQTINNALPQNSNHFVVDFNKNNIPQHQTKTAPVHLTETVSRNIAYKLSDDHLTQNQQELVDALRSGFDTSRATAAQQHFLNALNSRNNLTQDDLTSDEKAVLNALTEVPENELNNNDQAIVRRQSVTFNGTGTVDLTTGNLVTVDSQGNITSENGQITWTPANGQYPSITAPSVNGHTVMPSRINAENVLNSKTDLTGTGITIPGVANPTVRQVLDYEAAQTAARAKLPTDQNGNIIYDQLTDAPNYPHVPGVPQSQYIFDQYQLTDARGGNYPIVATLAVDRNDPTGGVYVYFNNIRTGQTLWSSMQNNNGVPAAASDNIRNPGYVEYHNTINGQRYSIQVNNYAGQFGNSVSVFERNPNFSLRRIFGYGAIDNDFSNTWGDYKPREITQTINYVDDATNQEIDGYPQVKVRGLIGQHFEVTNSEVPEIVGYHLVNGNAVSGSVSDYQVGQTYTRTWYDYLTNGYVIEHHTLINADGTMHTVVNAGGRTYEGNIPKGGYLTAGSYQIQNPFVNSTSNVVLRYAKTPGEYKSADRYFVYTPIVQKGSVEVTYHDITTDTDIPNVGYRSGSENVGTPVTYTTAPTITTLQNRGYELVNDPFTPANVTQITRGDHPYVVTLRHKIDTIDQNNPHGQTVQKTVTRRVDYTVDGHADNNLPEVNQSVQFNAMGHWDEVTRSVVDVVNGQVQVVNHQVRPGTLTWTAANSNQDSGNLAAINAPTLDGYHVNSNGITVTPTSQRNSVANTGAVSQVTVNHNSDNIHIVIPLVKNPVAQKGSVEVTYHDVTTDTDIPNVGYRSGSENVGTPITYTTRPTITDLQNRGYELVNDPFTPANVTQITQGDHPYVVTLRHKIDTIDQNNPHGQQVQKTVSRQVNYTVDGQPNSNLPAVHQAVNFNATGHWDEVTRSVVDVVNGQVQVINHQVRPGTLTWTAANSNQDSGNLAAIDAPTLNGYHVNANGITVTPTSQRNSVNNAGAVSQVSVNHNSDNIQITIPLVKNPVAQKGSVEVTYHDITTDTDIPNVGFTSGSQDVGTPVTYTTRPTITNLEGRGYELVNDPFTSANVTQITRGDHPYVVTLRHKIDTIDQNNPHGQTVQKTVTRRVDYTVDGHADSNLPEVNQRVQFNATGHWDEVTRSVVDVVNGQVQVVDHQVRPGTLTWTAANSNQDRDTLAAIAAPTLNGYHVNSNGITVDPSGQRDSVNNAGAVSQVSVNHNASDIHIVIPLVKNPVAQRGSVEVTYHDVTTDTDIPNVGYNSGTQNVGTPITYTTSQTITNLQNQGYQLVNDPFTPAHITQITEGDHPYVVTLRHKIDTIDQNNPHGQTVQRTVTRQVNYTVDGQPNSNLPTVNQAVNFNATGHWDEVTRSVVDVVNGQVQVVNHQVRPGALTWTAAGSNQDSGNFAAVAAPTLAGYHVSVTGITATPASQRNSVNANGAVSQVSVDHNADNITITIPLLKNQTPPVQEQAAQIRFVDDDNNDNQLAPTQNVTGRPNTAISFANAQATVTNLAGNNTVTNASDKTKQYVYVGVTGDGVTSATEFANVRFPNYDNDNSTTQTFVVHFRHNTRPVTPTNPTDRYTREDLDKTITRNITYVYEDGSQAHAPVNQSAHYTATGLVDLVTGNLVTVDQSGRITSQNGQLTWTPNGPTTLAAVTGPTITRNGINYRVVRINNNANGNTYNVDPNGTVGAEAVNHDSANATVQITYGPITNQQLANLTIMDDTTHQRLNYYEDAGNPNTAIQFNGAATQVANYLANGYRFERATEGNQALSVNSFDAIQFGNFDNNDQTTQSWTVYLLHNTTPVTPDHPGAGYTREDLDKTITRDISYQDNQGNQLAAPVHQQTEFTARGTMDDVTGRLVELDNNGHIILNQDGSIRSGQLHWTPAQDQTFAAVPARTINGYRFDHANTTNVVGYTTNDSAVSAQTVGHDTLSSTVDNIYTKINAPVVNQARLVVTYHDDTTDRDLKTDTEPEQDVGTPITYSTRPSIQTYVNEGYVLVRDATIPATMPAGGVNQIVYLRHGQQVVNPDHPGNPQTPNVPGQPQHPTDYRPSDLSKNVTRTIHYIISGNAQNKPAAPQNVKQTVRFTQSGVYDTVTGAWITPLTWSEDQTVAAVTSPTVNDYHVISVDRDGAGTNVSAETLTHNSNSYTVNVTYAPNAVPPTQEKGSITVTFHDDTTNTDLQGYGNRTGEVNSGTPYTYNPQTDLDRLIRLGYEPVGSLPTIPSEVPNTDLTYTIHVVHGQVPVNPQHPGHPGQPINPDNPNGPKYPSGTDQVTKSITRTIHYTGAGEQTPQDVRQTVNFTASGVLDKVTGAWITPLTWTGAQTVPAQATRFIQGYHIVSVDRDSRDGVNVDPVTLTHNDSDYTVTVTYAPNGHIIPVDPNHNPIPNAPHPQYPTNPDNPRNVTPNEPVPNVPGYTPSVPTVTPTNPGQDTPVVYNPTTTPTKDQVAIVNYIDQDNNNQVITSSGNLTGAPNTRINYSTATEISTLENEGYDLVQNQFDPNGVAPDFDNDDNTTQTFQVIFKHKHTTYTPTNPGTPGTPINPNYPNGPKVPNGTDKSSLQKIGTQTVHYVVNGGTATAPADNVKTIEFDKSVTVDNVTGQIISDSGWNIASQTYPAITSPAITGYTPNAQVVGGDTVQATDTNLNRNYTVTYTPNARPVDHTQYAEVIYQDLDHLTNGQPTELANSGQLSGQPGARINYSTSEEITVLESRGYVLANDGFPAGAAFDDDSTTNQTFYVTFHHGYSPVNPNHPNSNVNPSTYEKDVKETVHYTGAGNNTPADHVQNSRWSRTVTFDNVTHQLVPNGRYDTDWAIEPGQPTEYSQVDTPVVSGYHADQRAIPATQVTQNDITRTVTYSPNGKIIPVLPNGNPIPNAPQPQYPTNPDNPTTVMPNEPVPTVPGYTPTQNTVTPTNPGTDTPVIYNPVTPTKDQVAIVNYVDQDNHDLVIASSGNLTGRPGARIDYSTATEINTLEDQGYELVNNGFDPNGQVQYFDDNDATTQTFTVTFKHKHTNFNPQNPGTPGQPLNPNYPNGPKITNADVDYSKDVKETVHYTGAGNNTPADNVQTATWTRTITVDNVTGQIIARTDWSSNKTDYDQVDTPVVNGYHADQRYIPRTAVTQEDITRTVTYSPNGKIIPVLPNGNPIPGAPQPQYPTNPDNPTTVTPNEPVPTVPGYTPSQNTVTPTNPGTDTPVIYKPVVNNSRMTVNYVDQDDHEAVLHTDLVSGRVGTEVTYTTSQEIKNLTDEGYVLVNDGFTSATDHAQFTRENDGHTYTVTFKHGTATVNPNNPGNPGQPINPNYPNGPKWPKGTDKNSLQVIGHQTIHYTGAGNETPQDIKETTTFDHELVIDKVTGQTIADHGWTPTSHTFGVHETPVVNGYVANARTAGGFTATPTDPDHTYTVTYTAVGKIIPVDNNGKPIPGAEQPKYINNPHDATQVIPNEPVPNVPGYTPTQKTVTPENPTKDTPVVYNQTTTPVQPTNPTGPTTPTTPTTPVTPTTPTNPTTPVKPEVPPTPTAPTNNHPTPIKPKGTKVPTGKKQRKIQKGHGGLYKTLPPKATKQPKAVPAAKPILTKVGRSGQIHTAAPTKQVVNQAVPQTNAAKPSPQTLPQTGATQNTDEAAAIFGGAAAAIGLIGLAGVKKRRKRE